MEFIHVWHNAFSERLCDTIVRYIDIAANDDRQYSVGNNVLCKELVLDSNCATSHDIEMELHDIIQEKLIEFMTMFQKKSGHDLDFLFKDKVFTSSIQLRKITGRTRLHIDNIEVTPLSMTRYTVRLGTFIGVFSDCEDSLVFPAQQRTIKMIKGDLIFFPPFWTHPHESVYVFPSYRMVTWLMTEKPTSKAVPQ